MTAMDTAKAVLAKASLYDQTFSTPDIGVAVAWAEALGEIGKDDALRAVADHYASDRRRIMPADVLERVKRIREDRLRTAGNADPVYDGQDVLGGLRAIREHRRQIADGTAQPEQQRHDGPRRADIAELVQRTAAQMPKIPKSVS